MTGDPPPFKPNFPPYDPNDIGTWFNILFQIKTLYKLSEAVVLKQVLSSFPYPLVRIASEVLSESTDTPLTEFKARVKKEVTPHISERLQRLLESRSMGDQKPSEYFRYLKSILGEDAENPEYAQLLKHRFITALPPYLTPTLGFFDNELSIEKIVEGADIGVLRASATEKLNGDSLALARIEKQLLAISKPRENVSENDELRSQIASLRKEIEESKRVVDNSRGGQNAPRGRNFPRSMARSNRFNPESEAQDHWLHPTSGYYTQPQYIDRPPQPRFHQPYSQRPFFRHDSRFQQQFQRPPQPNRVQQAQGPRASGYQQGRSYTFVDGLCYFHQKFGDNAIRCDPQCRRYRPPFSHSGNGW